MCKEIGGYFEFERFSGEPLHRDLIALNSGRGCISYLVELRGIKTIWIPDWMCDSVSGRFVQEGVHVKAYQIGEDFLPVYDFALAQDEWLLLMDYYGQLTADDVELARNKSNGKLIVDETQGFFRAPWDSCDTTYTCRKWFGVSDGGYVSTFDGTRLERELPIDESFDRMGFVLGRFERSSGDFFEQAQKNNDFFDHEPAKTMSPLTSNILRVVDYRAVKDAREHNWDHLARYLSATNRIDLRKPVGPFMYPLMVDDGERVKRYLIKNKVFVPTLWPNVLTDTSEDSWAHRFTQNIVSLPIDQRYDDQDMERILSVLDEAGVTVG